ncbi:unnamed protein product [Candida verbasci]|uniref:UDP-N-acetylglucosamine transferase subunit ALG14 n=1 Tax=Candida verbasci TaxID=1227364 RepID=A0A9W4U0C2_9ASCO|nr:unnamed protein product [Candida verbasci]
MHYENLISFLVTIVTVPIFLILIRLVYILYGDPPRRVENVSISVFLGSGGHTGEMLALISKLDLKISTYICSDETSKNKVKDKGEVIYIPRARHVGQSYFTSIFTTLHSFIISSILLLFNCPSVLLLNGPGTSVPIAYIIFIYKFLGICSTRIIYIESLARVEKLSLSGWLLLPITNRFIVQWDKLYQKYNKVEYYGILL